MHVHLWFERFVPKKMPFARESRAFLACLIICSFLPSLAFAAPDAAKVFGDLRLQGGGGIVFSDGSIQYKAAGAGSIGPQGPAGPANHLTVGTVTTGTQPAAAITGIAPNQTLNLTLQPGPAGPQGPAGVVTLAAICNAISAGNMPLPSFCLPPSVFTGDFLSWTGSSDAANAFQLVRVNGTSGSVTKIGGADFFTSLLYGPDSKLYGVGTGLNIVDPSTGATVRIGDFTYAGSPVLMASASFSADGSLLVQENASPSRFFRVNLSNAALTYAGTPSAIVRGIAYAPTGALYGAFADLFSLNPINGSTNYKIGTTGTYISALSFGAANNPYGMDNYPSTKLYSVNLSTGLATPVAFLGSGNLVSLVAERRTASTSIKALSTVGVSQQRDIGELLEMERQFIEGSKRLIVPER